MTTRETSTPNRQGRESTERTSDSRQPSYHPTELQEHCNRIALEVQNIPAMLQEYIAGSERNLNSNGRHHNSNQQLNRQLQYASDQIHRKDVTIRHLEEELKASKREIQDLRAKEQSLRDSVLGNEHYQEISDEELISAYSSLRQGVQKIARSKLLQVDGRKLDFKCSAFALGEDLSQLWEKSERKARCLILRALLSQILAENVLKTELFAISGSEEDETSSSGAISTLNETLGNFENLLARRSVPYDIISNWRLATLRSIEAARLTGKLFGTALAEQMFHFFSSLLAEGLVPKDIEILEANFREICHQAYALRLLMRKSKHNYQCFTVSPNASEDEIGKYAHIIQELDTGSCSQQCVTLTLCGALVICPQSRNGRPNVLEKAEVARIWY